MSSAGRSSLCFSTLAALLFLQHTHTPYSLYTGCFFSVDALPLDISVTSSCLSSHTPPSVRPFLLPAYSPPSNSRFSSPTYFSQCHLQPCDRLYMFYFILLSVSPALNVSSVSAGVPSPTLSSLRNIEDSRLFSNASDRIKAADSEHINEECCLVLPHAQDDSWLCERPLGTVCEPQPGRGVGPGALLHGEATGWIWWAVFEGCPPCAESQKVRSMTIRVEKDWHERIDWSSFLVVMS